jgi:hypothetical protein
MPLPYTGQQNTEKRGQTRTYTLHLGFVLAIGLHSIMRYSVYKRLSWSVIYFYTVSFKGEIDCIHLVWNRVWRGGIPVNAIMNFWVP